MYEGDLYPTSEHAYQAAKVEERQGRESFTCGGSLGDNPMDAKAKGGKVKTRPNWDRMRVDVMLEVVRSKFARSSALGESLLATQNNHIVEGHTGDKFWGGKANHLGNILMRVRGELRSEQARASRQAPAAAPEEVLVKWQQRSKGSDDRRAVFQDQVRTWEDVDQSEDAVELQRKGKDQVLAQEGVDDSTGDEGCAGGSAADTDEDALPGAFASWLRAALEREVSASDFDALLCSVEVILSGLAQESTQDQMEEALLSAEEILRDDAPRAAGELQIRWATAA